MGFSENDLKKLISPTNKQLSAICRKLDNLGGVDNTDLLEEIRDILLDQKESVEPILYCDDDCVVTGAVSFLVGEDGTGVTALYFDANLAPTTTPPTGTPCEAGCVKDYELKILGPKCFQDAAGDTYQQYVCISYINNIKEGENLLWLLPDGTTTEVTPIGLIPCVEECAPATESFLGSAATLTEFDSYQILVSSCCVITITTSAGTIVLPAQPNPYSFNQEFKCLISDYVIAGDCIDKVTTILTKSK